jgi:hypothetical protein
VHARIAIVASALLLSCTGENPDYREPVSPPPPRVDLLRVADLVSQDAAVPSVDQALPDLAICDVAITPDVAEAQLDASEPPDLAMPDLRLDCPPGAADCNGNHADGCEAMTATDPKNCGGCSALCSTDHIIATCRGGQCVGNCVTGYADCDGDKRNNGCEANINTDVQNCGSCGVACSAPAGATAACVGGLCIITTCPPGYADCNKNASDGCEANLNTDAFHCGDCATDCRWPNIIPHCGNGRCDGSCYAGYADCDGNARLNGCEVNLQTDAANCGACARVCSAGHQCMSGICR